MNACTSRSILWPWHVYDYFGLFLVRAYAVFGHYVAPNFALSYHEDTFFWIQADSIQLTLPKYSSELRQVIHSLSRMNTQVININLQKTSKKILEYVTHEALKGRGCICHPKQHHPLGKGTSFHCKSCLVLIFWGYG